MRQARTLLERVCGYLSEFRGAAVSATTLLVDLGIEDSLDMIEVQLGLAECADLSPADLAPFDQGASTVGEWLSATLANNATAPMREKPSRS